MTARSSRSRSRWRPLRLAAAALLLFGSALLVVALFVVATPVADAAFGLVILGAPVVAAGALLWWIESMGSHRRGNTRHHRKRRLRSAKSRFTASEQAELTPSELNEYASMLGPVTEAAEALEAAEAAKAAHRAAAAASSASSFDGLQPEPSVSLAEGLPAASRAGSGGSSSPAPLSSAPKVERAPAFTPAPSPAPAPAPPPATTTAPTPAAQVWAEQSLPAAPATPSIRAPSPPLPPLPPSPPALDPRVQTPLSTATGPQQMHSGSAASTPLAERILATLELPERWTEATLQTLPWRRFEALIETLYSQVGFRIRTQPHGQDGGLHIWLYSRHQAGPPVSVVRCEHGKPTPVGVGLLRELSGVMYAQGARRGHYVSSAGYTTDAVAYAKRHGIHLLDLQGLVALIKARGSEQREALWQAAMDAMAAAD